MIFEMGVLHLLPLLAIALFGLSYFHGVLPCIENVSDIYSVFRFVNPINDFVAFEDQVSEFLRSIQ